LEEELKMTKKKLILSVDVEDIIRRKFHQSGMGLT
jgi:hypothetical protein